MNILYVEDDVLDADLTRVELRRSAPHFALEIATSQRAALRRLEQDAPLDLVLVDVNLPDGDGLSLLRAIREHGWQVAVVIITGGGDEETAVAALKAGADDYVVKRPGYLAQLPQTLASAHTRYCAEVARHTRPLRVLYAEDSTADANLTQHHLARHARHIHVEVIHNALEVLRSMPASGSVADCDVLLLDYSLPGHTALEVLRELLHVRSLDLPVVVVTGEGDEDLALQVLRLGAADYVVKNPGYLYKLPSVIENAFHRAQLVREQAALRQSEAKYRTLVEQLPAVTYVAALDEPVHALYVSPQVEWILGLTAAEIVGQPGLWQRALHPGDRERVMQQFRHSCATGEPLRLEYRLMRRDGRVVWLRDEAVVVRGENDQALFMQGLLLDVTDRKQAEAEGERLHRELQAAHAHLQALSLRLLEVQEAERRHLARELHDEIGQQLTGLKLLLDMNLAQAGRLEGDIATEARELVAALMQQVRELSLSLRPGMLDDLGLLPALLWHLERYASQTGVRVDFSHSGIEGQRFSPSVETAAYRIIQEALTNVARYARAREAQVRVWRAPDGLHLEINDQGVGFEPEAVLGGNHSTGLRGMSERAGLLGGQFNVQSLPGTGTRLTAVLPVVVAVEAGS